MHSKIVSCPKGRPPVTIAIGLLSNDAIIFAADSQTTRGNIKSSNAEKISLIKFEDGQIMVAQAGHADRAARAVAILSDMAATVKLDSKRAAADLVEQAISKTKQELKRAQCDCTMEELREFIYRNEQQFFLLIGYYFSGVPYFYVADFVTGLSNYQHDHFAAIGTGSEIANYILREHFQKAMTFNPTVATALYIVEEVKKCDSYCSGDTKFAWTGPGNDPDMMEQDFINFASNQLKTFNEKYREERNYRLTDMFEQVSRPWIMQNTIKNLEY